MRRIFVSYASVDTPRVRMITAALESCGLSVAWDSFRTHDVSGIQPLDIAACAIVVWSKASAVCFSVRKEARKAQTRGILVPVVIDDVRVPETFNVGRAVSFVDWDGRTEHPAFERLVRELEVVFPPPEHEAQRRIDFAARTSGASLDLSTLGVKVPESVVQLKFLRRLDLTGNDLQEVPDVVLRMPQLRVLRLERNKLSSLPERIGRLPLTALFLSNNQLRTLPQPLSQLTKLQVLDVSSNGITELPDWIGDLEALQNLQLQVNKLGSSWK